MYKYFISFLFFVISSLNFATDKLQIGITLQPYYSYVKNIVKDKANVYPTIKLNLYGSHSYQPTAEDIKNIEKIDVIFGEKNFSNKFVDIIHEETGVPIRTLEHLTTGEFTEDNFEKFIKIDLDEVINSIKEVKQKNE